MNVKKMSAVALGLALLAGSLAGCGSDDAAEAQRCVDQLEQTLTEAGSDRSLTKDEMDACNDPEQRAFILGED